MHDKLHEKMFISTSSFFLNKWKWLRICYQKAYGAKLIYWKGICCRYTLELPHRGNSNVYLQNMLLKIKKKLFGNLHFPSIMSIVFTSFKHYKLPISIKVPVTLLQMFIFAWQLYLQIRVSWTTSLLTCLLRGCNKTTPKFNIKRLW